MADLDKPFLVVIETQKVKEYLFASPYLRETRGASLLLDMLNRRKTGEILEAYPSTDYEEIYLGGGSGRVLFRTRLKAEYFQDKLLEEYRAGTTNARVAVAIIERREKESIPALIKRGVGECHRQKLGRAIGAPRLAGRWVQPCTSCGTEPAESLWEEWGAHRLCRGCRQKRNEVKKIYRDTKSGQTNFRVLQSPEILSERYTKEFIFTTLARHAGDKIRLPQDFNDIGEASKPSNYLGFIYADGNRMGYWVKKLGEQFPDDVPAKQAYKAFSQIVDRATREAAVEAVWENVSLLPGPDGIPTLPDGIPTLPAEFIMAGGDDLMLAVPAHNAMDVAIAFLEKFQKKTEVFQEDWQQSGRLARGFAPNGLSTSAGVVIAHAHYPARDLMTLASELMKIAKKKAADLAEAGKEVGTLDFLIVSEATTEPVKARRNREYKQATTLGTKISLTERPYTPEEARELVECIRALKDSDIPVPRGKLKSLYAALFQNHLQAQFDALIIKARLESTGALKDDSPLQRLMASHPVFPFKIQDNGDWATSLADLMELYDFIHALKRSSKEENVALGPEVTDAAMAVSP